MKKIKNILVFLCLTLLLPGCFEDETQRLLFAEDQQINTERNAFYAMTGILQQLQEIGDNYVILGELRGDLMDVTKNSSQELRDISNFAADSTNSYIVPKKYYALINNCNNLINKIDTAVVTNGSKTLMYEMKATKTIRAWTYLQLFQNFGKVYYYNQAMLDVKDQNKYTTISDFTQLSDTLNCRSQTMVAGRWNSRVVSRLWNSWCIPFCKIVYSCSFCVGGTLPESRRLCAGCKYVLSDYTY